MPLATNKQLTAIEQGEQLFKSNCATCHGIDKDLTGPALAHAYRLRWSEGSPVDEFIRNPAKVMHDEPYYRCLKDKYGGVVMTPFPALTNKDLDNLFAYIKNESELLKLPVPEDWYAKCTDSCRRYAYAQQGILGKIDSLIAAFKVADHFTIYKNKPTGSFFI